MIDKCKAKYTCMFLRELLRKLYKNISHISLQSYTATYVKIKKNRQLKVKGGIEMGFIQRDSYNSLKKVFRGYKRILARVNTRSRKVEYVLG